MSNTQIYVEELRLIQAHLPKFRVISKAESKLHHFIGWALRCPWIFGWAINSQYTKSYWTTIGQTSAYPTSTTNPADEYDIVFHEQHHSWQAKKWGPLFGPLYLLGTPVYAVVFALLALLLLPVWLLVGPWWVSLILVGVGALLSSPVPLGRFRAAQEYEAYEMTVALEYWTKGSISAKFMAWIAEQFTSSAYFYMHPSGAGVNKRLDKIRKRVVDGSIFHIPEYGVMYREMYKILQKHGRVVAKYSVPI